MPGLFYSGERFVESLCVRAQGPHRISFYGTAKEGKRRRTLEDWIGYVIWAAVGIVVLYLVLTYAV